MYQCLLVLSQPLGIIARVKLDLPLVVELPVRPMVNVKVAHRSASVEGIDEAGDGLCEILSASPRKQLQVSLSSQGRGGLEEVQFIEFLISIAHTA